MKKILCVGHTCVDITTRHVDQLPPPGLLKGIESVTMNPGGCASNAAIDLAKLGADPRLVIKIGADGFGGFLESILDKNKVDRRYVVVDPALETSATCVLIGESGERTFLHNPGANDKLHADDVPDAALEECDILFVAGTFLMEEFDGAECKKLLMRAKEKGLFTVLDTAWDFRGYWIDKLGQCLPHLDLFMPSYDEAVELCGGERDLDKLCDTFHAMGARHVIIKWGHHGAYISEAGKARFLSPSFPAETVVDTTGAGDSFCAGFLYALAEGADFHHAARVGNAVGHHCVGGVGATYGIPTYGEILVFLENADNN